MTKGSREWGNQVWQDGVMIMRRSAPQVLSIVLAGGQGTRLLPLTSVRAKPAVPYGGQYRLIDFALSNLANGGFRKIVVLTQYKSHSLDVHLSTTWRLSTFLGNYVTSVPAQMRMGKRWFVGSADALFQNINIIEDEEAEEEEQKNTQLVEAGQDAGAELVEELLHHLRAHDAPYG